MKYVAKAFFVSAALVLPVMLFGESGRYPEADKISAAADKKLNAAYERLIKDIRAGNDKERAEFVIASLRESQRAWLKYRDAQVGFVGSYTGIGELFRLTRAITPKAFNKPAQGCRACEATLGFQRVAPNPVRV